MSSSAVLSPSTSPWKVLVMRARVSFVPSRSSYGSSSQLSISKVPAAWVLMPASSSFTPQRSASLRGLPLVPNLEITGTRRAGGVPRRVRRGANLIIAHNSQPERRDDGTTTELSKGHPSLLGASGGRWPLLQGCQALPRGRENLGLERDRHPPRARHPACRRRGAARAWRDRGGALEGLPRAARRDPADAADARREGRRRARPADRGGDR